MAREANGAGVLARLVRGARGMGAGAGIARR
jgi:hypothetical protein